MRNCVSYAALFFLMIVVAVGSFCPTAKALSDDRLISQYRLDSWSTKDGLHSRTISSIVQTHDGYLWLGTPSGLVRFDGASFQLYNRANTPSLTSNDITALLVERDGTLLVGTQRGGFGEFRDGKFIPYGPITTDWNITNAFVQSPDGSIWVGGSGTFQLCHIMNRTNVITCDVGGDEVMGLAALPDGGVLDAPADVGLLTIDLSGKSAGGPVHDKLPANLLSVCVTHDGTQWVGSQHEGLIRVKGSAITRFTVRDGLTSNTINTLYEDPAGNLWIGTNNGLCFYNGHGFQSLTPAKGLLNADVHAVMTDRDGNLWVAAGSGLNRLANTKLVPYVIGTGTSVPEVKAACPSADGGVWCATTYGLWRVHEGTANPFECRPNWPKIALDGLVTDRQGFIWPWHIDDRKVVMCRIRDGVDPEVSRSVEINFEPPTPKSCSIWRVLPVDDGFWVFYNDGRCVFWKTASRDAHGLPLTVRYDRTIAESLGWIFNMKSDPKGVAWIACVAGLVQFDNGKITMVNDGLSAGTKVLDIAFAHPDEFWVSTDRGLAHWIDGRFHIYDAADGLPANAIGMVAVSPSGDIWATDDDSLFCIKSADVGRYDRHEISTLPLTLYGAADGVRDGGSSLDACDTGSGRLWFPSKYGFTLVDPTRISTNPNPPAIVIEDADVNGNTLKPGVETTVQPCSGALEVRYAALSFAAPEKVAYRYRLAGYSDRWFDAGTRRTAGFTNLAPGRYTFTVVACNEDGFWDQDGAEITFDIQPHYYQTAWFRIAIVLLALAAVYTVMRLRLTRIHQLNLELEKRVAERTAQLSESLAQTEEAKSELREKNIVLEYTFSEIETQNRELLEAQKSLAEANARLETLARVDTLTGLNNLRAFNAELEREWSRHERSGTVVSLIMLDIDHFKHVNDTYGHPAGDDVLRRVAEIIRRTIRDTDIAARYGGEEFVVLLPEADALGAGALAERLRLAIELSPSRYGSITASLGIATSGIDDTPDGLISRADIALYQSKRRGRNRITQSAPVGIEL